MTAPLASRRSFITGLVSLVAAPAIVRAGSLMPVRAMIEPMTATEIINRVLREFGETPLEFIDCDVALHSLLRLNGVPNAWLRQR